MGVINAIMSLGPAALATFIGSGVIATLGERLPDPKTPLCPSRGDTFLADKFLSKKQWGKLSDVALHGLAPGAAVGYAVSRDIQSGSVSHSLGLASAYLLTRGITNFIKKSIARERPDRSENTSFPSGHSSLTAAMTTFTGLSVLENYSYTAPIISTAVILGLLGMAAVAAIARMGANKHYWEDVSMGLFLGGSISVISRELFLNTNPNLTDPVSLALSLTGIALGMVTLCPALFKIKNS